MGFHERDSEYNEFMHQLKNTVGFHERYSDYSGFVNQLKNTVGFHDRYSEYSGFMNLKTLWGFMKEIVNIVGLWTYKHCGVSWKR